MAAKAQKIESLNQRGRVGREGEALAADFLSAQGFTMIARNWRCRMGELDLIAVRDGRLHFVEVKARRNQRFGYPEEAVSRTKRQRWFRAIELWLQSHAPAQAAYQADVITILWVAGKPKIDWIQNVELV